MGIRLSEHRSLLIRFEDEEDSQPKDGEFKIPPSKLELFESIVSMPFKDGHCFLFQKKESGFELKADYYVGLDWLGNTGRYLYVEPKINNYAAWFNEASDKEADDNQEPPNFPATGIELDYLKMLLQVMSVEESNKKIEDLVKIDWVAKPITINQHDDRLTPFLIVRFLQTLKNLVRKGLKKNYYKVQENLPNRVKGKILVGQHIKQNVFKNRFTTTYCEYQVFGLDHAENRFLKKVLLFATAYVENNKSLFGKIYSDIQHTIDYCRPAFELVSDEVNDYELKQSKYNPFYKEYSHALQTGRHILKRFAYNITQTSETKIASPPFWIDMPMLFELYVYSKMVAANPSDRNQINFQFKTYGNALDILVAKTDFQMVIDAKYKLHYKTGQIHKDIRQVAGYARLNKVRQELGIDDDTNIDCLIIYPDIDSGIEELSLKNIANGRKEISHYHKVYKLGVKLPFI